MSTPNAQLTKLALGIAGVAALTAMIGQFSLGANAVGATEAAPTTQTGAVRRAQGKVGAPAPTAEAPTVAQGEPDQFQTWGDDGDEEKGEAHEYEHTQDESRQTVFLPPLFAKPQAQSAPAPVISGRQGQSTPTVVAPTKRTRTRRS